MKNNFKPGDIVILKIPTGKQLIPGNYNRTGFQGGLVSEMVSFLNSREKYEVTDVVGNYIKLKNNHTIDFLYDYTWFEKVNKNETINDTKIEKTVKSVSDRNNDNIDIIISLLRALKIDKDTENKIIDVLFEKEESKKIDLSEVSKEKLLEEIAKRMW